MSPWDRRLPDSFRSVSTDTPYREYLAQALQLPATQNASARASARPRVDGAPVVESMLDVAGFPDNRPQALGVAGPWIAVIVASPAASGPLSELYLSNRDSGETVELRTNRQEPLRTLEAIRLAENGSVLAVGTTTNGWSLVCSSTAGGSELQTLCVSNMAQPRAIAGDAQCFAIGGSRVGSSLDGQGYFEVWHNRQPWGPLKEGEFACHGAPLYLTHAKGQNLFAAVDVAGWITVTQPKRRAHTQEAWRWSPAPAKAVTAAFAPGEQPNFLVVGDDRGRVHILDTRRQACVLTQAVGAPRQSIVALYWNEHGLISCVLTGATNPFLQVCLSGFGDQRRLTPLPPQPLVYRSHDLAHAVCGQFDGEGKNALLVTETGALLEVIVPQLAVRTPASTHRPRVNALHPPTPR